jgi:hypothetical protein
MNILGMCSGDAPMCGSSIWRKRVNADTGSSTTALSSSCCVGADSILVSGDQWCAGQLSPRSSFFAFSSSVDGSFPTAGTIHIFTWPSGTSFKSLAKLTSSTSAVRISERVMHITWKMLGFVRIEYSPVPTLANIAFGTVYVPFAAHNRRLWIACGRAAGT